MGTISLRSCYAFLSAQRQSKLMGCFARKHAITSAVTMSQAGMAAEGRPVAEGSLVEEGEVEASAVAAVVTTAAADEIPGR